jgi:hypothetical protein
MIESTSQAHPSLATSRASGRPRAGATVVTLAVVFYVLLIDAAVETVANGSPARWWVAGAILVYLVLSALARNRVSWATRAHASFVFVLGLLAVTSWLPDGGTQGIIALRQTTPTLLSAVTGLGVVLATVNVIRLRILPFGVKCGIALLATYGVAAFMLGAAEGTPYRTLFSGGSFWQRLPSWLQGAVLSSLVILPVGLVMQVVAAVRTDCRAHHDRCDGCVRGRRLW